MLCFSMPIAIRFKINVCLIVCVQCIFVWWCNGVGSVVLSDFKIIFFSPVFLECWGKSFGSEKSEKF